MSRRFAALGGIAVIVVAVGLFGVWYYLFRDDAPPPVDLQPAVEAAASVTAVPAATGGTSGTAATPGTSGASSSAATGLAGSWQIGSGTQSFVGYRVQEQLADVGGATRPAAPRPSPARPSSTAPGSPRSPSTPTSRSWRATAPGATTRSASRLSRRGAARHRDDPLGRGVPRFARRQPHCPHRCQDRGVDSHRPADKRAGRPPCLVGFTGAHLGQRVQQRPGLGLRPEEQLLAFVASPRRELAHVRRICGRPRRRVAVRLRLERPCALRPGNRGVHRGPESGPARERAPAPRAAGRTLGARVGQRPHRGHPLLVSVREAAARRT